ncbi:putative Xaa-Pro aminopeptidase [Aaosphaeria arxii CBS 175.79]|uniref:Xaa-Pro aminopeptidase n=1 Tax=Aaosphaeria arxii CBS 175.79 TaxID=1450172 RepID=A0A6A5Y1Z1_9PLEO|nr:putative Xaa-Pro aminopeptidase [Aaosphaeria arxii CBS 175.79]KAF2019256.1 putative Xaa-Pro aminopeptidase [Aaosphaeria arxii CBS 175.79]
MAIAENYDEVLKGKYPAKTHAKKVVEWMLEKGADRTGTIYLEAQKQKLLEDNDSEAPFRQRRYFYYLSGCELPDSYLTYDIQSEKLTLFIPPVEPEEVIWSGLPMSVEEALAKYDVDEVKTTNEVNPYLTSTTASPQTTIYAIPDQISDHITFLSYKTKNLELLKPAIEYSRVVKTDYEIALIRKANAISTAAHTAVMKAVSHVQNETELEAIFLKSCVERGAKHQAYHSIVAAGTNGATLHYVKNDDTTTGRDLLLLDAGCEVECYASDITRTFPISGTFTPESSQIYNLVLSMQKQTTSALKAGAYWDDIHALAHRIAIDGLLSLGILKGDRDAIFAARTSVAFLPHGLGHYLGMDTHDTGGNANYKDSDPMFRYLRVRGTLPARSVITVEPGIYFCRFIIEPYLKDPKHAAFIDTEVLERYWSVGGVRIEDNILVTEGGYENLTPTPKEPEELKKIITGS